MKEGTGTGFGPCGRRFRIIMTREFRPASAPILAVRLNSQYFMTSRILTDDFRWYAICTKFSRYRN
jgi:hypothetical protein